MRGRWAIGLAILAMLAVRAEGAETRLVSASQFRDFLVGCWGAGGDNMTCFDGGGTVVDYVVTPAQGGGPYLNDYVSHFALANDKLLLHDGAASCDAFVVPGKSLILRNCTDGSDQTLPFLPDAEILQ